MKAVVYTKYGNPDVLEYTDIEKPIPQDNDVLIKVHAVALNFADWGLLRGKPVAVRFVGGGLFKPQNYILGADVAGTVAAVGKDVTQFQPGDEVFGDLSICGWGALAEYVCGDEDALVKKPANVSFEQAAAVPLAGITALQGLLAGNIQAGQKVLINGASGGVGSLAVQIAKAFDTEVTAVCSTTKLDMVKSMGADHAIDYTKENFTENGKLYDLILGVNGYHPLAHYKRALEPNGTYICAGGTMSQIFQAMLLSSFYSSNGKKLGSMGVAKPNQKDLTFLKELLEAGKLNPVIDNCYPLAEAADAFQYIGTGHAKGKVIVKVI